MRPVKLYSFDSVFDFGQCLGESVGEVFQKSPSYISWCFQKVDWFCITDNIFNELPIVVFLKKDKSAENKKWLLELETIHKSKMNTYLESN